MSHTFDSGLADALRTLLGNAIKTKLAPLLSTSGGFVEATEVIAFGIQSAIDAHKLDLLWDTFKGRTPAIAIFPGAMKPKPTGGPGKSRGPMVVDLYYVTTHRRDPTEGRATMDAIAVGDDTADPGIFATLELAWARLVDVDLGVGAMFGQLKLEDEDEIDTNLEYTVWKQTWSIDVSRDANMYRGITEKFTNARTTMRQSEPSDEPTSKLIVEDTIVG